MLWIDTIDKIMLLLGWTWKSNIWRSLKKCQMCTTWPGWSNSSSGEPTSLPSSWCTLSSSASPSQVPQETIFQDRIICWIFPFRELKDPLFNDEMNEKITDFVKVNISLLTTEFLIYFRKISTQKKEKEEKMNWQSCLKAWSQRKGEGIYFGWTL